MFVRSGVGELFQAQTIQVGPIAAVRTPPGAVGMDGVLASAQSDAGP